MDLLEQNMYVLLLAIKARSGIGRLHREGINYNDIAELLNYAIEHNFVEYNNEEIIITKRGAIELDRLEPLYKKIDKDEWIDFEVDSKIPKIRLNDIFLPSQNEIHF